MATNSRTRSISYKPRYTQMEAYDLLPPVVRDALKEGPQEWDTGWLLREYKSQLKKFGPKTAGRNVARIVHEATANEIAEGKPWRDRKPGQRWRDVPQSPHNQAGAAMALSGLPTTYQENPQ